MNGDFHYYATYCAAVIAGYSHPEAMDICYCAQFVDHCTKTILNSINGPEYAATTQLQSEMIDMKTDKNGLREITRIWASFHFLPRDLYAERPGTTTRYLKKYRMIAGPNGDLVKDTVELAKNNTLQAVGIAMHVLADTWAHANFAGTPSFVINNTDNYFDELIPTDNGFKRRHIEFGHNPAAKENPEKGEYTASIYQASENSIMNLGHGRAGHLPDYSFIRYAYVPAWNDYYEIIKDNPHDYLHAFAQMVYALQYLRGMSSSFEKDTYAWEAVAPYEDEIKRLIAVRRTDDTEDWKALGERITGQTIRPFRLDEYFEEYRRVSKKDRTDTFLEAFFDAAMDHKNMIIQRIVESGNDIAGKPVNLDSEGSR